MMWCKNKWQNDEKLPQSILRARSVLGRKPNIKSKADIYNEALRRKRGKKMTI